jgi:hypothetical protein
MGTNRPVQRTDDFAPGDFSFLKNGKSREMLTYDYKVLDSVPSAWEYFKDYPADIPFILNEDFKEIMGKFWQNHTIDSFRQSMNVLKSIAQIGWEDYVFLVRD